jgi:hypothetical protein
MSSRRALPCVIVLLAVLQCGCATTSAYDYTVFWQHPPRSILVLPPMNESNSVEATYGYLSTVTRPLVDRGYYVFPVEVVDQLFKENGMPTAGEMHQVSLAKVAEITGADAVLFVTVEQYSNEYHLVTSSTNVHLRAQLLDTRSGALLWEGKCTINAGSGYSADPVAMLVNALVTQVISSQTDNAHKVSVQANYLMIENDKNGLPYGPYNSKYVQGGAPIRAQ